MIFYFYCITVGILGLDRFSPSPLFIYSLDYLYQYRFMDSCFIQWIMVCYYLLFWYFSRIGQLEPL